MFQLIKILVVSISLYLSIASGVSTCRQCHGPQIITFVDNVPQVQALEFFRASLGECAINGDYEVLKVTQNFKTWTFDLQIWRYCGTGGSNYVDKGAHCIAGVCAASDKRRLICPHSVECHGTCHKEWCGC